MDFEGNRLGIEIPGGVSGGRVNNAFWAGVNRMVRVAAVHGTVHHAGILYRDQSRV